MRYLLAFGDTEGVEGKNGLWSLTLIFTCVVLGPSNPDSSAKWQYQNDCFHVLNFNSRVPTGSEKKSSSAKALATHFDAIQHLQMTYKTDGVLLCFYNAGHDRAQIEAYKEEVGKIRDLRLTYLDTLKFVKNLTSFPKYNLDYLRYSMYGSKTEKDLGIKQDHTSLHDTLLMIDVLYAVVLDSAAEQIVLPFGSQVDNRRYEDAKDARPFLINAAFKGATLKTKVKAVVGHEAFFFGILQQRQDASQEKLAEKVRQSSVTLISGQALREVDVDARYDYFTVDDVEYKLKKGYKASESDWCKGYGLYYRNGEQYKMIRNREKKRSIIGMIRELDSKQNQMLNENQDHQQFVDAEKALQKFVLM